MRALAALALTFGVPTIATIVAFMPVLRPAAGSLVFRWAVACFRLHAYLFALGIPVVLCTMSPLDPAYAVIALLVLVPVTLVILVRTRRWRREGVSLREVVRTHWEWRCE